MNAPQVPFATTAPPQPGGEPLVPARRPTGAGRAGVVGPVLAVLLLAVAAVLGREALVAGGVTTGSSWLAAGAGAVDGLRPSPAVAVGGVAVALVGLWLLATAFARRSRNAVGIAGSPAAGTTTHDVARLATGAARQVDGVLSASSRAGRRRVDVTVQATATSVGATVEQAVDRALQRLEPRPRVRVRVGAQASADLPEPAADSRDGAR